MLPFAVFRFEVFFSCLQAEVIFLGQLSHPNLVKLIGYCCEDDHRVLVYEFMPLGSVESHLFSSNSDPILYTLLLGFLEFVVILS